MAGSPDGVQSLPSEKSIRKHCSAKNSCLLCESLQRAVLPRTVQVVARVGVGNRGCLGRDTRWLRGIGPRALQRVRSSPDEPEGAAAEVWEQVARRQPRGRAVVQPLRHAQPLEALREAAHAKFDLVGVVLAGLHPVKRQGGGPGLVGPAQHEQCSGARARAFARFNTVTRPRSSAAGANKIF